MRRTYRGRGVHRLNPMKMKGNNIAGERLTIALAKQSAHANSQSEGTETQREILFGKPVED